MKRLLITFMLFSTLAPLAGCIVAPPPRPVYRPAPACVWVPDHYNAYGAFVPGHCKR